MVNLRLKRSYAKRVDNMDGMEPKTSIEDINNESSIEKVTWKDLVSNKNHNRKHECPIIN